MPVFDAWLDSDPHFIKQMARHIAKKLYYSSYNRGERLFYSSSYLLLKYVAGEMEALGLRRMEKAVLRKNRRQISEELGMQEKTVNRTIARLCEEGESSQASNTGTGRKAIRHSVTASMVTEVWVSSANRVISPMPHLARWA